MYGNGNTKKVVDLLANITQYNTLLVTKKMVKIQKLIGNVLLTKELLSLFKIFWRVKLESESMAGKGRVIEELWYMFIQQVEISNH